jgi:hypothetical protein
MALKPRQLGGLAVKHTGMCRAVAGEEIGGDNGRIGLR